MSYKVRWTLESKDTFNQNLQYLSKEWDHQVIGNFLDRVEEVLEKIRKNPELYPVHRVKDKVHKCVVNKRIIHVFQNC